MNKYLAETIFVLCVGGVLALLVWSSQDKPLNDFAVFAMVAALCTTAVLGLNLLVAWLDGERP